MTPANAIGSSAIRQVAPPQRCLSVLGRLDHAEPDHPHTADHSTTMQTFLAALSPSGFRRQIDRAPARTMEIKGRIGPGQLALHLCAWWPFGGRTILDASTPSDRSVRAA